MLDECRICREVAPELNKIYTLTKENNIGFVGYFPNLSSNDAGIQKFRKNIRYNTRYLPILKRISQKICGYYFAGGSNVE
ncbi:MAG: hypothetical protein IPG79_02195 [Saprospiraceae bacterium]|nr:hypothetical protein [Saprospiraceae bacterium]